VPSEDLPTCRTNKTAENYETKDEFGTSDGCDFKS
jgi:hypothetical protein